jgi:hypothetical protein
MNPKSTETIKFLTQDALPSETLLIQDVGGLLSKNHNIEQQF